MEYVKDQERACVPGVTTSHSWHVRYNVARIWVQVWRYCYHMLECTELYQPLSLSTNKRIYLHDAAIIMTVAMFFSKWWPELGKVKRGRCVLCTTRSITAWGKEECFRHVLLTDFIRDQTVSIDLWTVRLHSNAMFRLRFAALYSISVTHWFVLPLATGDIHTTNGLILNSNRAAVSILSSRGLEGETRTRQHIHFGTGVITCVGGGIHHTTHLKPRHVGTLRFLNIKNSRVIFQRNTSRYTVKHTQAHTLASNAARCLQKGSVIIIFFVIYLL
jgi:hypothetical protein